MLFFVHELKAGQLHSVQYADCKQVKRLLQESEGEEIKTWMIISSSAFDTSALNLAMCLR